jgi:hypothetical protein
MANYHKSKTRASMDKRNKKRNKTKTDEYFNWYNKEGGKEIVADRKRQAKLVSHLGMHQPTGTDKQNGDSFVFKGAEDPQWRDLKAKVTKVKAIQRKTRKVSILAKLSADNRSQRLKQPKNPPRYP